MQSPLLSRYGLALAAVVLAALGRAAIPWGLAFPFLTFYPAIAAAALAGGFGPGCLATVVSALLAAYFWIEPLRSIAGGWPDSAALTLFILTGMMVSALCERHNRLTRTVVAMACGLERQIADTRNAHAAREAVIGELQRQQALMDAVLRHLPSAAIIAEAPSGRLLLANDQVARIWRLPATPSREAPGYQAFRARHPDGRPFAPDDWPMARCITRGETVIDEDIEIVRGDGTPGVIRVGATPIRDAAGRIIAGVVTCQDITERAQLERERNEALARAEAARTAAEAVNRAKDDFLAVLSHELRTPLTAILGWIRLLRRGQLSPERMEHALRTIERNTFAQAQLVNDLLDVSRIVSGKMTLRRQAVDLLRVVMEATQALQPQAEAKGIRLDATVDAAAAAVAGDATRLQQIVANLVANAVKFTPEGGRVDVRLERAGPCARITVADTGEGIEAGALPHIFERFRQADSTIGRRHGGLGLGLAIVRHLCELHGGRVSAASAGPGRGATFTVELPLAAVRPGAPDTDRIGAPPPRGAERIDGVHVLVVDDDADTCDVIRMTLEEHGGDVRTATSAEGALALLRSSHESRHEGIDVVVSDLAMPGVDGYQLLRRLRTVEEAAGWKPLPAIALTAYASAADRERALDAGFLMHAAKPIDPGQLVDMVATAALTATDR